MVSTCCEFLMLHYILNFIKVESNWFYLFPAFINLSMHITHSDCNPVLVVSCVYQEIRNIYDSFQKFTVNSFCRWFFESVSKSTQTASSSASSKC